MFLPKQFHLRLKTMFSRHRHPCAESGPKSYQKYPSMLWLLTESWDLEGLYIE